MRGGNGRHTLAALLTRKPSHNWLQGILLWVPGSLYSLPLPPPHLPCLCVPTPSNRAVPRPMRSTLWQTKLRPATLPLLAPCSPSAAGILAIPAEHHEGFLIELQSVAHAHVLRWGIAGSWGPGSGLCACMPASTNARPLWETSPCRLPSQLPLPCSYGASPSYVMVAGSTSPSTHGDARQIPSGSTGGIASISVA